MSCDTQPAPAPAVSTTNGAVPEKSSIVDLKNGKVVFKQKPISFEKHSETLQEIVKFREMLEERISRRADALPSIPDEYKPVIAKLAHESDKTLSALSKHILQELLPVQDEDDEQNMPPPLTLPVVESGVKSVANRNNYGLDGMSGVKAPAAVCVWRWEAKPAHLDWLPKNAREKAENRIAERVQAKSDLKALLDSLPKDEHDSILDPKGTAKASVKDAASTSNTIDLTGDTKSPAPPKKKKENEENDSTPAPKVDRPKKIVDSDKTAKEKEKQEKKAAKIEREQKEKDAQKKSQSLMQNFLKSKATTPRAVPANPASEVSASSVSEFDKTFKPFVVKKDTTVAPINWFNTSQNTNRPPPLTYDGDIIIVDDADDVAPVDVSRMNAKDRLSSTLQGLPFGRGTRTKLVPRARNSASAGLKTRSSVSVRDMIAQLNEAEVSGDVNFVRSMLTQLSDRDIVPAKVFIFADDARPGYFGTWTRNSRIIGPRTPFARDVAVFDYGYDSGEEWEEEAAGDADDVIDDGEDEDGEVEDADSDLDSWLVDDEDEPQTPQTPADSRGGSPVFSTLRAPVKRKAEATEDPKLAKKRKVVVPLVPFAKGPAWEQTIGRCEYNMFNSYRIQLFNDTPFPIDPFTFVSECGDTTRTSKQDGFAVPSLPDRLVAANPTQPDTSPVPSPAPTKRAALAPKTVFPDIHLTHLLNKITTSSTASLPILIDTIYQDLKDQKVKKNSIEAKVREVAEKCKVKKVWIVKENFRVAVQGA
ncbi:chromatin assembly factor 1 subunit A-domain-containing protein [Mycena alexandri]|uniref:Chromatin assembly factor 1 subunit A-domain-containing protein n=1 Tax=Mycena alexandri TaxID=1745969 RepID=A0AAD6THC1_9AGAR|nr:chromatin assembly factor 1 subunit A-domain-containing protein [Mycena alexandri]